MWSPTFLSSSSINEIIPSSDSFREITGASSGTGDFCSDRIGEGLVGGEVSGLNVSNFASIGDISVASLSRNPSLVDT